MHSINFYNFEERKDYKQGQDNPIYNKKVGDIMNIFFNSRINANQSLLNVLFGQQQKRQAVKTLVVEAQEIL